MLKFLQTFFDNSFGPRSLSEIDKHQLQSDKLKKHSSQADCSLNLGLKSQ